VASDPKPVTDFIVALGDNPDLLQLWRDGKRGAAMREYDPDGTKLSASDRDLLADGDVIAMREKVLAETSRGEAQPLMVIGI
jgi:hypothetical protein